MPFIMPSFWKCKAQWSSWIPNGFIFFIFFVFLNLMIYFFIQYTHFLQNTHIHILCKYNFWAKLKITRVIKL